MTEILPDLHVGDLEDCRTWPGKHKACVLEVTDSRRWCDHLPFLEISMSPADGAAIVANPQRLEAIGKWYDDRRREGPVLIHCAAGIERSPLAVAYILVTRFGVTWEDAYALLIARRPQVQDRRIWLPPVPRT